MWNDITTGGNGIVYGKILCQEGWDECDFVETCEMGVICVPCSSLVLMCVFRYS